MIGGDAGVVKRLQPLFEALARARDRGWAHVGPIGAGHFTKMVHNGIEYGLMQSYAEGFALLEKNSAYPVGSSENRRDLASRQRGSFVASRSHRRSACGKSHPERDRSHASPIPVKADGWSPRP